MDVLSRHIASIKVPLPRGVSWDAMLPDNRLYLRAESQESVEAAKDLLRDAAQRILDSLEEPA